MEQAVQAYRGVLASDDLKEIERLRFLARCNETSALNRARRDGIAQGITQGILQTAKAMKNAGFSPEDIVKATNLPVDDILRI